MKERIPSKYFKMYLKFEMLEQKKDRQKMKIVEQMMSGKRKTKPFKKEKLSGEVLIRNYLMVLLEMDILSYKTKNKKQIEIKDKLSNLMETIINNKNKVDLNYNFYIDYIDDILNIYGKDIIDSINEDLEKSEFIIRVGKDEFNIKKLFRIRAMLLNKFEDDDKTKTFKKMQKEIVNQMKELNKIELENKLNNIRNNSSKQEEIKNIEKTKALSAREKLEALLNKIKNNDQLKKEIIDIENNDGDTN